MCVLAVTQVATVSVSVLPLLPTLKSVTARESTFAGGPRSSVVCESHMTHAHPHTHTVILPFIYIYFCLFVIMYVLFLTWDFHLSSCLLFPLFLQPCSVRTDWCMILVVQLALLHVPAFSGVHTPSVELFPVWRAASALLAWSCTVRQIYQSQILLNTWCKFS